MRCGINNYAHVMLSVNVFVFITWVICSFWRATRRETTPQHCPLLTNTSYQPHSRFWVKARAPYHEKSYFSWWFNVVWKHWKVQNKHVLKLNSNLLVSDEYIRTDHNSHLHCKQHLLGEIGVIPKTLNDPFKSHAFLHQCALKCFKIAFL